MRSVIFLFNIFLFFLLFSTSLSGQSQHIDWHEEWDHFGVDVFASSIDEEGNVYHAGSFISDLSIKINGIDTTLNATNSGDMFITKMDENGNWLWVKQLGGVGDGLIKDLVTDIDGNIYLSGSFKKDIDFDPNKSTFIFSGSDVSYIGFVCKLSKNGDFIWVTKINEFDEHSSGESLAIDEFQNVYCTGSYHGPRKIWSPNFYSNGYSDVFLMKFDIDGKEVWSKKFGGSWYDRAYDLKFLSDTQLVVVGIFSQSVDFDPSEDTLIIDAQGKDDAFMSVFSTDGDLIWTKTINSTENLSLRFLDVDKDHNIYSSCSFVDTLNLVINGVNQRFISSNSSYDALVLKINQYGNILWVKQIDGDGRAFSFDSEVSTEGDYVVSIMFDEEVCYEVNRERICYNSLGYNDVLFLWFNGDGEIIKEDKLEGSGDISVYTLAINKNNILYASGQLNGNMKINSRCCGFTP